ncbi:MAG: hypothetical protein DRO18_04275 [Thermoprotei archaeon]|nr:MAG: hypothetical protein DRO18_04275 [Thermoprotei archaeon]
MRLSEKELQEVVREALEEFEALDRETIERIVEILEEGRAEIIRILEETPSRRWNTRHYPRIKRSIERALDELQGHLSGELENRLKSAFKLGLSSANGILKAMVGIEFEILPLHLLKAASAFSADLITDLTTEARQRINREILTGLVTGKSVHEVAERIGLNLLSPSVFRTIRARAETIARTETLRIYSIAQQEVFNSAGRRIEGLKKQWIATLDLRVRPAHAAAHKQIVPFNEPFTVGGEKLMFPRDPAGSAKNTVNCRCTMVPVLNEDSIRVIGEVVDEREKELDPTRERYRKALEPIEEELERLEKYSKVPPDLIERLQKRHRRKIDFPFYSELKTKFRRGELRWEELSINELDFAFDVLSLEERRRVFRYLALKACREKYRLMAKAEAEKPRPTGYRKERFFELLSRLERMKDLADYLSWDLRKEFLRYSELAGRLLSPDELERAKSIVIDSIIRLRFGGEITPSVRRLAEEELSELPLKWLGRLLDYDLRVSAEMKEAKFSFARPSGPDSVEISWGVKDGKRGVLLHELVHVIDQICSGSWEVSSVRSFSSPARTALVRREEERLGKELMRLYSRRVIGRSLFVDQDLGVFIDPYAGFRGGIEFLSVYSDAFFEDTFKSRRACDFDDTVFGDLRGLSGRVGKRSIVRLYLTDREAFELLCRFWSE